jgi:nitroimidazol reductase NimA-like FMN-containing flavoprotein (pyridoxamine 5'-phosphate oxidase superfamily)
MNEPLSDRTAVRRLRDRARYDREFVNAVLDEALVCHVGFVADHGPVVLPMTYARHGDIVYLHGAPSMGSSLIAHRLAASA